MPAMVEELRAAAEPHFLVVTYPAQGHINPARHLARRLVRATGARVTVSTAVSAFRKMFPGEDYNDDADAEGHRDAAGVWHVPYSDGYDAGFDRAMDDHTHYMSQVKLVGSRTLSAVLDRLRDAGRPVTFVVYTLLLPWAADVARDHGVPAALYWIQPGTVLAAYVHFFRGTDGVDKAIAAAAGDPSAAVNLPGPPAAPHPQPAVIHHLHLRQRPLRVRLRHVPRARRHARPRGQPQRARQHVRRHGARGGGVAAGARRRHRPRRPRALLPRRRAGDGRRQERRRRRRRRKRPVQAGRGLPRVAGRAGARLGRVHLLRESVGDEHAADRGAGARHVGKRSAVPVDAAGGQPRRRCRRHRVARRRARHGGGVVRPGAGALAPGGGVLRHALRLELDAGERGVRGARRRGAPVDGPGHQRVAAGEAGHRGQGRRQRQGRRAGGRRAEEVPRLRRVRDGARQSRRVEGEGARRGRGGRLVGEEPQGVRREAARRRRRQLG